MLLGMGVQVLSSEESKSQMFQIKWVLVKQQQYKGIKLLGNKYRPRVIAEAVYTN